MVELEDLFGTLQVLETVQPKIECRSRGREAVAHKIVSGLGKQGLSPMPQGKQSCDPIERRPEVVAIALLSDSGMQSHAYTHLHRLQPQFGLQGALSGQGRSESVQRHRKRGAEGVAHGLEDETAAILDGFTHQGVMPTQRRSHRLGMRVP
jgi:hypothetical protein